MGIGAGRGISTAGSSQLVSTHIRSAGDCFTSTALVAGHHTTHTGLDARHGSRRGADTNRSALTNGFDSGSAAVLAGLLEACIRSSCYGLAAAGLVTCDVLRAAGAGSAHHLVSVGDTETNLGSFRLRFAAAKGIDLLSTDVLITGHTVAGAEFITGDLGGATHQSSSDARTRKGA